MNDAVTMVPNPFGMPAPEAKADQWAQFPDAQQPTSQASSGGNDQWSQFPDAPSKSDQWAQFPDASAAPEPAHLDRFLNGVYKGYAGADQLLGHAASYVAPEWGGAWAKGADKRSAEIERQGSELSKKAGLSPDASDWWNVAGQVASPVNWAAGEGAVAAASAIPKIGRAVQGSNILKGALQGSGIAATQPVANGQDYGAEKLGQLGTGAITGGIAAPVMSAVGTAVKPAFDKTVQTFLDAGARLTPGQMAGPGITNWTERQAGKFDPFGSVNSARRRGQVDMDRIGTEAAETPAQATSSAPASPSGPISEVGQAFDGAGSGVPSKIVTPDGSMEVPATPRIVELDDLKHAEGNLQPRDRTRQEYIQGARERAARLDPEQLQPNRVSDSGAPVVLDNGTILSGNGRTLSIAEAYSNPALKAQAEAYKASLGPAAQGMKKPVLVMQTSMEPDAAAKFADLSNRTRIDAMSATERAARDARALGDDITQYQGGDFDSPANAGFVRSFIAKAVSPAEMPSISKTAN